MLRGLLAVLILGLLFGAALGQLGVAERPAAFLAGAVAAVVVMIGLWREEES